MTPLPKRPKGPNDEVAILIPYEAKNGAELVNIVSPPMVVGVLNNFIDEAQMELAEFEGLPKRALCEHASHTL